MQKAFHHWNTGKSLEDIDWIALRNCFLVCIYRKQNMQLQKCFIFGLISL